MTTTAAAAANDTVPATPAVRRLANRLGVGLAAVAGAGTGAGGRIRTADVHAAAPTPRATDWRTIAATADYRRTAGWS